MTPLEPTSPDTIRPRATVAGPRLALETLVALAAYAVVAGVVTWPVVRSLRSTVLGPSDSDSAGGIWWLDAVQAHGYHLLGSTRFTQIAVPYGVEQANALNLQWLVPYLPAYLATKAVGEVAAFNLTVLSGFALSGAAMYLLARYLRASRAVSAWAGLAFLLFPWHVERAVAGHASLVHLECFPLLALALLLVAERRSGGRLALVAGAVALCWLTSGYYGVMALIAVPAASIAVVLGSRERLRSLATAVRLTAVAGGVTIAVYALSLLGAGGDPSVGAVRSAADVTTYGLRPAELVLPAPGNPTLRRLDPLFWEPRKHGSNIQEVSNYLGWVTLLLAAGWVVAVLRRRALAPLHRAATAGAAGAFAAAFVLALPGSIEVAGARFDAMPSRLLFAAVPAFRVPTRWTVVLFLAALVVATLGLDALTRSLRARPGVLARAGAAALVAAALGATWVELRVTHPGVHYRADELPAEYDLLAGVRPGALAEYPLVSSESSTSSEYLLRQRLHGRPLLNGGSPGTEAEDARRALVDPTAPGVPGELAARGVVAVITRPDTYSRALEAAVPAGAPRLGRGFSLVGTAADGASVWRVTAPPARAVAFLAEPGFLAPTLDGRGRILQELRGPEGSITLVAREPFLGAVELRLVSRGGVHRVSIGDVSALVGATATAIRVPVSLPAGRSALRVEVAGVGRDEVSVAATAPILVPASGTSR